MNEAAAPAEIVAPNVTGKRIIAAIIDLVILGIVFVLFAAATGGTESDDGGFSVNLEGAPAVLYFLVVMAYYIGMESMTGRTVGKMAMGLKVVSLSGEYSVGKAAIRNVLRIVDGLPVFYLVGFICVAVTKQKQRIGDMAAGTIVTEG